MTRVSRHSSKPSFCKQCGWWQEWQRHGSIWGKVFKSRLSNFFKGCLPQSLLSRLLNSLSHMSCLGIFICYVIKAYPSSCQNLLWKESPLQIAASTLLRSTAWRHNIAQIHYMTSQHCSDPLHDVTTLLRSTTWRHNMMS